MDIDFKPDTPIDFQGAQTQTEQPTDRMGSTINKYAAMPAEAVNSIPGVGPYLSPFVPSTPAGWGGTAAALAAAPLTGGMSLLGGAALTGGAAALGGAVGGLAGGQDPGTAAIAGAGEGLAQGVGYGVGGWATKQLKGVFTPIIKNLGDKMSAIIPGIRTPKPDSTWFHEVVLGTKGTEALSTAYEQGVTEVKALAGNTLIQEPRMTAIISDFKKFIPSAGKASIVPPIIRQSGGHPADLAIGAMDASTALQVSKELSRAAANINPKNQLAPELRAAAFEFRDLLAESLPPDAAAKYSAVKQAYGAGINMLNIMKKEAGDIFVQSGGSKVKIDEAALAAAYNNAQATVNRWQLGQVAAAARRGGAQGTGASRIPLPALSIFGGGQAHARFHRSLGITNYPGNPIPATPMIGGITGQRLEENSFGDLFGK